MRQDATATKVGLNSGNSTEMMQLNCWCGGWTYGAMIWVKVEESGFQYRCKKDMLNYFSDIWLKIGIFGGSKGHYFCICYSNCGVKNGS